MKFQLTGPLVERAGFALLILIAGIVDPSIGVFGLWEFHAAITASVYKYVDVEKTPRPAGRGVLTL